LFSPLNNHNNHNIHPHNKDATSHSDESPYCHQLIMKFLPYFNLKNVQIKLCDLTSVKLLDKKGYLTVELELDCKKDRGTILLRETEGIQGWFQDIYSCWQKCGGQDMQTAKQFWSKQAVAGPDVDQWLMARQKIGEKYNYTPSTISLHKTVPESASQPPAQEERISSRKAQEKERISSSRRRRRPRSEYFLSATAMATISTTANLLGNCSDWEIQTDNERTSRRHSCHHEERRHDDISSRRVRTDNDTSSRRVRTNDDMPSRRVRTDDDMPSRRVRTDDDMPSMRVRTDDDMPSMRVRTDDDMPSRRVRKDDDMPSMRVRTDDDFTNRIIRNDDTPNRRNRLDGTADVTTERRKSIDATSRCIAELGKERRRVRTDVTPARRQRTDGARDLVPERRVRPNVTPTDSGISSLNTSTSGSRKSHMQATLEF